MDSKQHLLVLDFDGFLINSYGLLKDTFKTFNLDIGDESRFKNRKKFMKYLGGGKEFLPNLVRYSLPKKKKIRQTLTEMYVEAGTVFPEFTEFLNNAIDNPDIHAGIISRNYTLTPGNTIRSVLRNSKVNEKDLDFVIPVPVGVKKHDILIAMNSSRYKHTWFGGDEVGDYRAATQAEYSQIFIGSYGFDTHERLIKTGEVPKSMISDSPAELIKHFSTRLEELL